MTHRGRVAPTSPGRPDDKENALSDEATLQARQPGAGSDARFRPPGTWAQPDHFLTAPGSAWYRLVLDLYDTVLAATADFWRARGARAANMSLTTRTVTCADGRGSDACPVAVNVNGVETFLSDSMQFFLEYGCRFTEGGCWGILPSFRAEQPDETHLSEFTHSEAEIPGDLDDVIVAVEAYVRALSGRILDEHGAALRRAIGDIGHVERAAGRDRAFERLTFAEAVELVGPDGVVEHPGTGRTLHRAGERRLIELIDEFVWVTHFDHLSVPFYQAFGDPQRVTAANADLFFGIGEVVGAGQRHSGVDDLRASLATHGIPEEQYDWYVRLKERMPMRTAGFGMGVERLLLWVLGHHDIRDLQLVPRFDGPSAFPAVVDKP